MGEASAGTKPHFAIKQEYPFQEIIGLKHIDYINMILKGQ